MYPVFCGFIARPHSAQRMIEPESSQNLPAAVEVAR
jgi:hypothetical protein